MHAACIFARIGGGIDLADGGKIAKFTPVPAAESDLGFRWTSRRTGSRLRNQIWRFRLDFVKNRVPAAESELGIPFGFRECGIILG